MEHLMKLEIGQSWKDALEQFAKYKYAVLILLLGVVLMTLPPRGDKQERPEEEKTACEERPLEQRLKQILEAMDGVGAVEVLLTLEQGNRSEYQTDFRQNNQPDREETEENTVLVSDGHGADSPVIVSWKYPLYRGAVVVCQGADSPTVKLHIVRAVSSATGLSSDKISVIKMSGN